MASDRWQIDSWVKVLSISGIEWSLAHGNVPCRGVTTGDETDSTAAYSVVAGSEPRPSRFWR
jgi:hypothetical protein